MHFSENINGFPVEADYSDVFLKDIAAPLVKQLQELQRKRNRRIIAYLAAPPAAGKSTMAAFLQWWTGRGSHPILAAGMDGFHHYQEYLCTHTMERNGKRIQMVQLKGAPETFHLEALRERLERLQWEESCPWPTYDRRTHNPQEGALQLTGDIILVEGNYLLLDWNGWRELKELADYTITISAESELLRERLLARKLKTVADEAAARKFVEESDLYNARTILENMLPADLELVMTSDGDYIKK